MKSFLVLSLCQAALVRLQRRRDGEPRRRVAVQNVDLGTNRGTNGWNQRKGPVGESEAMDCSGI